jgi:hypothetical protein
MESSDFGFPVVIAVLLGAAAALLLLAKRLFAKDSETNTQVVSGHSGMCTKLVTPCSRVSQTLTFILTVL